MRTVKLEASRFTDVESAHRYLATQFDFPAYYGMNLDALSDCLGEEYDVEIFIDDPDEIVRKLGEYGEKLIETISTACEENEGLSLIITSSDKSAYQKMHCYFDYAATSFKRPDSVYEAVIEAMKSSGNSGRGSSEESISAGKRIYKVRKKLSDMINANNPMRIAFTKNSTEALNIAISDLKGKGHIISSVLEHNSVLRPLHALEKSGNTVTYIGADKNCVLDYDAIYKSIKKDTVAIVMTHGSNLVGNLVDIKRIGKIAADSGLRFIVDASQTAGIFDIDVADMNIDVLCMTGHKSLMGPQGTGAIYVREGIELKPIMCGGTGTETFSLNQPQTMPTRLESGTMNSHGIAGLGAGLDYISKMGSKKLRDIEESIVKRFYDGVSSIRGIEIYGDFSSFNRAPIVALNVLDYSSDETGLKLQDCGISTRTGGHCAPLLHMHLGTEKRGAVRFSFSHFTTEKEIDYAINALREIVKKG